MSKISVLLLGISPGKPLSVAQLSRDDYLGALAHRQLRNALVKALDHALGAELELERLASVARAIPARPVCQVTVSYLDGL
jgi:hypothetical protein